MVTIEDVRAIATHLPRSYEVFVRGRVKFRVGQIVYLSFSRDETLMGFAFPKEEREAALETFPEKFLRPKPSDLRFQWLVVRLDATRRDGAARARPRRLADGRAEAPRRGVGRGAPAGRRALATGTVKRERSRLNRR